VETLLDGCARDEDRAEPSCFVDFDGPLAEDELAALELDESAEPVLSAEATAGIEAIAAPTPSANTDAPTQLTALK
jgi:hypothetical protein